MNRWRVGEDRGSKETDGCPLTVASFSRQNIDANSMVKSPQDAKHILPPASQCVQKRLLCICF
jgi:hypothetical protein